MPSSSRLVPSDAQASVSIAVGFDQLVKDADTVGIATPVESKSLWEDGRIWTYTRLKIEQGVAGELGTGSEGWVRTMGGVVGKIGQMVDGEPVFTTGKSSLLFMRKFKATGTWEISARGQGQYPVVVDEVSKTRKIIRSATAGVLFPPRATAELKDADSVAKLSTPAAPQTTIEPSKTVRLAGEVMHDRAVDEVLREVAASWKKLHPAPTPSDAKK